MPAARRFTGEVGVVRRAAEEVKRVPFQAVDFFVHLPGGGDVARAHEAEVVRARHIRQIPVHQVGFAGETSAVVGVVIQAAEHVVAVYAAAVGVVVAFGAHQDGAVGFAAFRFARGEDVVIDLQAGGVPAQALFFRPGFFAQAAAVFVVVAAAGTRFFFEVERVEDVREGVVVDAAVAGTGEVDAAVAVFDDVGGEDAAVADFVHHRGGDAGEEVVGDFGVDAAFVAPVAGRAVGNVAAVVHNVAPEDGVAGVGDFGVADGAVGAAVGHEVAGGVVVAEVAVFDAAAVGAVHADGGCAVVDGADVVEADAARLVHEKGGVAVLRDDAVFHAAVVAVDTESDGAAEIAEARVAFEPPGLVRRVVGDVDAAHGEVFAGSGESAGAFADFHAVPVRVAAEVVGDGVLRAEAVAAQVVVGFDGGGRGLVLDIEGAGLDFGLAADLGQRAVVDEDLFGIGGNAFFRRVGVDGADVTEVLEIAGHFPQAAFFFEAFGRDDVAAFQPDIAVRLGLQGDAVAGDEEMRLAVDAAFQDEGRAVARLVEGGLDGAVRFVAAAVAVRCGIRRDPEDVGGRHGIVVIGDVVKPVLASEGGKRQDGDEQERQTDAAQGVVMHGVLPDYGLAMPSV